MDEKTKAEYLGIINKFEALIKQFESDGDDESLYAARQYRESLKELINEYEWLKTPEGWESYLRTMEGR